MHNGGHEIHSQRLVGNSTTKREGRGGAGKRKKVHEDDMEMFG